MQPQEAWVLVMVTTESLALVNAYWAFTSFWPNSASTETLVRSHCNAPAPSNAAGTQRAIAGPKRNFKILLGSITPCECANRSGFVEQTPCSILGKGF